VRRIILPLLVLATTALAQDMPLQNLLIDGEGWQPVAQDLGFADGPCTDEQGNFYYSDLKAPAIYRVGLDGKTTKLIDELASGLKFGSDGRLYACQGAKKRLIAIKLDTKEIEEIATDVQPNDLAVTHRGHIYFTETGKHQITFVNAKTKEKRAADTGITAPNGITISPDQGTLAVSDYKGANVWTFRIKDDGSLDAKAPYMTMRLPIDPKAEYKFGGPPPLLAASGGDGMTSDVAGRYYVATTLGVQVFDPTGRLCGVLPKPVPDKPLTSCGFAGAERAYLYVTNGDRIFRRKVQATGNIFFKPPGK
jgi:enterochelin esterase family protein